MEQPTRIAATSVERSGAVAGPAEVLDALAADGGERVIAALGFRMVGVDRGRVTFDLVPGEAIELAEGVDALRALEERGYTASGLEVRSWRAVDVDGERVRCVGRFVRADPATAAHGRLFSIGGRTCLVLTR